MEVEGEEEEEEVGVVEGKRGLQGVGVVEEGEEAGVGVMGPWPFGAAQMERAILGLVDVCPMKMVSLKQLALSLI